MKTRQLYYEDVYQKEFEGDVVSCRKGDQFYELILDRTAFYPEGGGQPADHGFLCQGDRRVHVLDVQEEGDHIIHYTDGFLEPSAHVYGVIDWDRRFDLMQQHSGEHIVSGLIHEKYGYDNVGFHMGADFITIDLSGMLNEAQVREIETEANRYIWENHQCEILLPDRDSLAGLDYRSKKELSGQVRLVEFKGADLCACCGLHVRNSGEIGMVLLADFRRFHQGVRIEMAAGKRAFDFLKGSRLENSRIASALSVREYETYEAVLHLKEELYEQRGRLIAEKKKQTAALTRRCRGYKDVLVLTEDLPPEDIRKCTDGILDEVEGICAVFSGNDRDGYRYALGSRSQDVRAMVKEMNRALTGRGGGKALFCQGSVRASAEEICAYFEETGIPLLKD